METMQAVKYVIGAILILLGVFYILLPHSVHVASGIGLGLPHSGHILLGIVLAVLGVALFVWKKK